MEDKISIEGMDKTKVLEALYASARPQGLGFLHFRPGPLMEGEAAEILSQTTYIDYLMGRVMKVELGGGILNPWLYDRDNGQGAAERALRDAGLLK